MTEVPLTNTELLCQLKDQIPFLKASTNSYDNGFAGEAKRLALSIRILVHVKKTFTALLVQLDKKNSYYNLAYDYKPHNSFPKNGLVKSRLSTKDGAPYCARLDDISQGYKNRKVTFDE